MAAALPPVRDTVLATAAGTAKLAMAGPMPLKSRRATAQPMANDATTDTEAARLAASLSPPPKAVDTALVVPTLIKTIVPVIASQIAHAGPIAASWIELTWPTVAVSMRLRRVGLTYMGIANIVNLSSVANDGGGGSAFVRAGNVSSLEASIAIRRGAMMEVLSDV